MVATTKPKPSAAQAKVIGILQDGSRLTYVSGKFGGWLLKDASGKDVQVSRTTCYCLQDGGWIERDSDASSFGVARYKIRQR